MPSPSFPSIDVREIIARKAIETHFQPIISMRRQSIVGVEALSRGTDNHGQHIPPMMLFHAATAQGSRVNLTAYAVPWRWSVSHRCAQPAQS
jgi:EAL domain-containing protein (putative c-di-GMP-specific phosphodiesterase class I)